MANNPTSAKWNNKTEKIMDRPEIKNELNSSILLSDSGTIMSDPATANHAGQTTPISTPSGEKPNAIGKSNAAPKPTYFVFWSSSPAKWPIFSHSVSCSILLFFLATKSLPILQSVFEPVISTLASSMLRAAFIFTGVLSLLHQTGALRRYALHFVENELSKIMNGTLVTLSDIEVDIWRGRVIARDLIIHNKDRAEWDWESPCLARVGRIETTVNFASLIEVPHYGQILNHTFKDVYTALVEDVQVFIEKRRNIFNFHLLDPTLDIPDASLVMEAYWERKWGKTRSLTSDDAQSDDDNSVRLSKSMSLDHGDYRPDSSLAKSDKISLGRTSKEDSGHKVEANRIVERLVGGLTDLGKATSESGTKGLQSVLRNQRQSWIENLKRLHSINSSTDMPNINEKDGKDRSEPLTKKTPLKLITKDKVAEGIDVMRQLGKVVEKNVAGIKENMEYLQKPPPKKAGLESKPPNDMIRIGSFLLREMRIFTKDVLGQGQNAIAYPISNVSTIDSASISTMTGNETATKEAKDLLPSGWSPPIVVWELAITGAEFSPPMSARDSHSGLPVVGIPVERAVDIIVKRLLTETAKSNSGRLFQTAFGDVFSFVEVPRRKQSSAKASEK